MGDPPAAAGPTDGARRVLVAAPAGTMRLVVEVALRLAGDDVLVAEDRAGALAAVAGGVDVVVLADPLPPTDGPDVLATLRGEAATAGLPVVRVLAVPPALPPDGDPLADGADALLVEPFAPARLLEALDLLTDAEEATT